LEDEGKSDVMPCRLFDGFDFAPAEHKAVMWALLRQRPQGRVNPNLLAGHLLELCFKLEQLPHIPNSIHLSLLSKGEAYVVQEDM
jgi:hypothetical protein